MAEPEFRTDLQPGLQPGLKPGLKLDTHRDEAPATQPDAQPDPPCAASAVAQPPSPNDGLTEAEAARRLAADGPNALPSQHQGGAWRLLRTVATEPMFLLLVGCGAIYLLLGDPGEAAMLLGFVFVVMGLSFFQQRRAERSIDALRELASPQALVVREGRVRRVPGRELVRGDVVLLSEGDRVPADMVLVAPSSLAVDESMLTGESVPVQKQATASSGASGAPATDSDASQVFSGTLVTQGSARALVNATGADSALGRIGASLASLGNEATPIQQETRRIVRQVALGGLILAAGLALGYWAIRGDWLHGALAGLTLAMAILPEELPVVLTLFLGLGAWRLSRERVLTRNIPAIELLGAATVLCVDKTGTLTRNRMTVRCLWSESAHYDCLHDREFPLQEALHGVLEFGVLASHRRAFDPMESAIGEAGQTLLAHTEHLHADWTLIDDYALSPEMLAMSRVWQSPDLRERMIAAKGAPEAIVDLCHLDAVRSATIAAQVGRMAEEGLRVLGVARAVFGSSALPDSQHDFAFEFLGLVALEDPVRDDVPAAIAECNAAGIRVVMITGDHAATALAIARQAGLRTNGNVMTGAALAAASDALLRERLATTSVFCRVRPEQKLRLVQAFRARGDIVAMTGDGVNDAPALKAAHIGVAMGARGTDVAREAADLVLLGDDFGALVTAVRYGRRVFANLRKAIVFVVAVHVPIVGLSLVPVAFGWPMLLMPVHVLFLQLIIDPACSIVFEAEPIEPGAMRAGPRRSDAHLFDAAILTRGLWQGGGLLLMLLGLYALVRHETGSDDTARALTFAVLVASNLGLIHVNRAWEVMSWRTRRARGPSNRSLAWIAALTLLMLFLVLGIPALRQIFAFRLPDTGWLIVAAGAVLLMVAWFEGVKWVLVRRHASRTPASESHR